jgi:type III protein arginine methyltransferase
VELNGDSKEKVSAVLEALISSASSNPRALATLAHFLVAQGEVERACSLALQARTLAPGNPEVAVLTAEILNAGVPQWQFSIIRDERRNMEFDAALRRAVRPGSRVLDIGSGTGLLAMMAVRAGASEVITCEMNPLVAQAARKIVAANGYADTIRVLGKHSESLDVVEDLGGPVDVLVAEIVANDILAEGVIPVMENVVHRLLKPGGQLIPARGSVRVALAHYSNADKRRVAATVAGFDLSLFNELAPKNIRIKLNDPGITILSDAADLFTFDFASGGPFPEGQSAVTLTSQSSASNGIAQWIHLNMDDEGQYENDPRHAVPSSWSMLFYPFAIGLQYSAGEPVTICGSHDRHQLRLWTERA